MKCYQCGNEITHYCGCTVSPPKQPCQQCVELQKKLDEALYDKEQIIKNCWTGAEVAQVFEQAMSLLFDKKTEGE